MLVLPMFIRFCFLSFVCSWCLLLSGCVTSQNVSSSTQGIFNSEAGRVLIGALSQGQGTSSGALSAVDIESGLREALRIGTGQVVSQLGQANGFFGDSAIRIPLPGSLQRVDSALSAIGMSALTDDLELRLNRAAEAATPKAKALFVSAISQMSFDDAKGILQGPQDSATQYLRRTMGPGLYNEMLPLVDQALSGAGALQAYDRVLGQYKALPFMPDVQANLNQYVREKALDGIFYYVAKEEAAIRSNPAKRTTDLLKKVFGAAL